MQNIAPSGREAHGVQSIARAGAILRALERSPEGLGLTEIATATELPKSTVHRLVSALVEEELLARGGDGSVQLGAAIARLGSASHAGLAERLRPILIDLRRELDETVDLSVLDGTAARFVDQVAAPHRLRATSAVGELFPLHCTANGKALLAALPVNSAEAMLPRRLPRLTPHTIVAREALLAELARVRTKNLAFDREEHSLGISAVGAAVCVGTEPVAAISVPVPTQRFRHMETNLIPALVDAASRAAELLAGAS